MMGLLNKCCCCINLRIGGLIIAYLQLIISILFVPYDVFLLNEIMSEGTIFRVLFPVFSFFLVYGIHKNDPGCMIPSLIVLLGTAVLLIIFPIITCVVYFSDIKEYISEMVDEETMEGITVLSVALGVIYVLSTLILYFWFVLFSLYKSTKKLNDGEIAGI